MIPVYFGKFGKHKDTPRRWGNFWEDIDGTLKPFHWWNLLCKQKAFFSLSTLEGYEPIVVLRWLQTNAQHAIPPKNDPWTLLLQWLACTTQQLEIKSNWQGLFIFRKWRCVKTRRTPAKEMIYTIYIYIPYIRKYIYIYRNLYERNRSLAPAFWAVFFSALLQVMMPSAKTGSVLLHCWEPPKSQPSVPGAVLPCAV